MKATVAARETEAPTAGARRTSRGIGLRAPGHGVQRQADLEIGPVDDPLEREADRVAAAIAGEPPASVARRPANGVAAATIQAGRPRGVVNRASATQGMDVREAPTITPSVRLMLQRKCAACEEEEKRVHAKRSSAASSGCCSAAPPIVHQVLESPGQPLDHATRSFFEPQFGRDFSDVQLHTDGLAANATESIGAKAFAYDNHIAFASGHYNPQSAEGRHLLAHELTHVLQQSAAIHRQPKPADPKPADGKEKQVEYCHHGYRRGVALKGKQVVYAIMLNGQDGDTYAKLESREVPLWIDWRYGAISAEDKAKILAEYRRIPDSLSSSAANIPITAGCQYAIGLTLETYARFNRIGDKVIKPPEKEDDGDFEEGQTGGKTGSGGGVFTGKKDKPPSGPVPEESPTIGISNAAKESEKIKHDKTAKVKVDLTVFEKDAKLSQHLLDSLEHFAGRKISADDVKAASDGLSADELDKIIGGNASYRTLTSVYTQGWNEFKAAGGKDADAFFLLEEALLEQLARGNPTAATNKLEIGKGNLTGEDKIIGIRHRDQGWLLYDETGTPFPGFSGMGYRDQGFVGSRVNPDGSILNSFQLNIAKIEDPGLQALLNSLRMTIGDPTRVTIQAAEFIFDNVEILKDGIIQEVPAKIKEGLKDTVKYFIGFMVGEAASSFMMRSANPTLMGIGLALKVLLKAAEYEMDVQMIGDIVETLYEAGRHLVKVEKRQDGTFTKLSERHLRDARAPIVSLLTQIGMLGAMKAGGKIIGIIARLRAGGKAEIHCSFCTISDAEAPAAEGKGETGKAETGKAEAKGDPAKPEAKNEVAPDKAAGEPAKPEPPKPGDPNAPKEAQQPKPPESGTKDAAEQGKAAETPQAKLDAAKRGMETAQARTGRFSSLVEALAAARKKLQEAKNRQVIQRGGNVESNAAVRDANAQIADILSNIKKEFDVDPTDPRAMESKRAELIDDFKQAKDTFTPLDVALNPKKYRAKLPCFVAGTPVATPQGPRPIEALAAGDQVIAFDFDSGRFAPAVVAGVHRASTDRLVHITVAGQAIVATSRHPFWVEDMAGWVEAHALRAGMRLKTIDGSAAIEHTRVSDAVDTPTFNLQVEGLSSFCVGPGVLVHNEGVDAGQGGSYIIYRITNKLFPGKRYIGQTTTSSKTGKARGAEVRKGEHIKEAEMEIEAIKAELGGKPASAEVQERLDFFEFKKGAEIEILVYGIGNQAQADWLEQQNIDIERGGPGKEDPNVMNRRNQISKERMQQAKKEIMEDPKIKCP